MVIPYELFVDMLKRAAILEKFTPMMGYIRFHVPNDLIGTYFSNAKCLFDSSKVTILFCLVMKYMHFHPKVSYNRFT